MTLRYKILDISFGKYNNNFQFMQCMELGTKTQRSLTNESDSV